MKFHLKDYPEYRRAVADLSVRQLLKLVACPQVRAEDRAFEQGFQTIFLHETTKERAKAFLEHYNRGAEHAALTCTDTECGAGDMLEGCTRFPSMQALGLCGSKELAYQVGRVTAQESREAGYCWSLAPCVDIRLRDESPAVSTQAAGPDAQTVIDIAGSYMKGLQDGGVAATIKHFPGDGATEYDPHLTTAVNPLTAEQWRASYGLVYKTLIDEGAMCVMPGHVALPCLDEPDAELGLCPPATLSKRLMTDLLRGELGFDGIICSDALTMSGFSGFMNYYKACATFLNCGGDVLLFVRTDERYYEKMEQLVESGFLPLDVLRDRACRVMSFTRQVREELKAAPPLAVPAEALSRQVVRGSIRVARDRARLIPFAADENTRLLVVDFSNVYTGAHDAEAFYKALRARGYQAEFRTDPGAEWLAEAAESGRHDLILCTVCNGVSYGTNVLRLHGARARNMMEGWTRLGTPVIFLALWHDGFANQFAAVADTVVNTCGVADSTWDELLDRVFQKKI